MPETCSLCDRVGLPLLGLGRTPGRSCAVCARRLGRLLVEQPEALMAIWPELAPEDDSPEPKVRLADGRTVELRERTAEMKRELSLEKRAQLAELLGELGLVREQLLEAGFVLDAEASPELAQRALDVLFGVERASPAAVRLLRRHLLPS